MFTRFIITIITCFLLSVGVTSAYMYVKKIEAKQERIINNQSQLTKNMKNLIDNQKQLMFIAKESEISYYNILLMHKQLRQFDENIAKTRNTYRRCLKQTKQNNFNIGGVP